jgi:hypothetical protein
MPSVIPEGRRQAQQAIVLRAGRMDPDRAVGRHDNVAGLERPPGGAVDLDRARIERVAEQGRRDRPLAWREGACQGAGSPAATVLASTVTGCPLAKRRVSLIDLPGATAGSMPKIIA